MGGCRHIKSEKNEDSELAMAMDREAWKRIVEKAKPHKEVKVRSEDLILILLFVHRALWY
jgi:hypothetical protein